MFHLHQAFFDEAYCAMFIIFNSLWEEMKVQLNITNDPRKTSTPRLTEAHKTCMTSCLFNSALGGLFEILGSVPKNARKILGN